MRWSTATSMSAAVVSTRAEADEPPARRMVTDVLPETTWALVRIVSGATKKPLPIPVPVSTRTTAGIARLITSSSGAYAASVAGIGRGRGVTGTLTGADTAGASAGLGREAWTAAAAVDVAGGATADEVTA